MSDNDAHEPAAKRARTVADEDADIANNNDDDDDDLLLLDDSGNFVSPAERQAAAAEQRRAQRRERLRQVAAAEEEQVVQQVKKEIPSASTIKRDDDMKPAFNNNNNNNNDTPTATAAIKKEDSGTESFDMFTTSPPPPAKDEKTAATTTQQHQRGQGQQDWDDAEGYYNAVIGETIVVVHDDGNDDDNKPTTTTESTNPSTAFPKLQFRVDGKIGQGVFSTVLKVTTLSNPTSAAIPPTVAIKMIRSNETMAKAASNEIRFLHQLRDARGVIPLLLPTSVIKPLEHRGHVMLVFPFMEYNLRDVLQKFGKGVGVSLPAVRSYFGQLLSALTHLKKRGIIHADLKPDNILINGDFSTVYLADFGSAFETTAPENQPTPYLVSRFYRAPEIILGLTPTIAIDLWSLAVSVAELFLGNVLFRGKSNNDMLYVFMQHLGAFSNRVVRSHMVQLGKLPTLARQFHTDGPNYVFLQQTVDTVTGDPIHKRLPLVTATTTMTNSNNNRPKFPNATPLSQKIMRAKSANDTRTQVQQFADLLQKCLALDPSRRIALKDALGHEFFRAAAVTEAATFTTATS